MIYNELVKECTKSIITLDGIFKSGMVFQRYRKNLIWGHVNDSDFIRATLDGKSLETRLNGGLFEVVVPPHPAGTNHTITLSTADSSLELTNLCFGDVYLLSGQSNMELPLSRVLDVSEAEILSADFPLIRQFRLQSRCVLGRPAEDIPPADWIPAVWPHALGISAAGFFFARSMQAHDNVPIGLVLNAQGGSHIESWMSAELLDNFGEDMSILKPFFEKGALESSLKTQQAAFDGWYNALKSDDSVRCSVQPDHAQPIPVPGMFFDTLLDGFCGSLWFYREVYLRREPTGQGLLYLGALMESDCVWINGEKIGCTGYRYPPRRYTVKPGILKKGRNLIAIRLVVNSGIGGFVPQQPYYLETGAERVELAGVWQYVEETRAKTAAPALLFTPSLPTGLFNASILPIRRVAFRAILWYQGESNAANPEGYDEKFAAMIKEWRALFGLQLPVICVEMPDYSEAAERTSDTTGWAEIQRMQRNAPESVPLCAVARAKDLGMPFELHPQRKQELGERLAKAAQRLFSDEI
jgi:sialate O-acetylesterase